MAHSPLHPDLSLSFSQPAPTMAFVTLPILFPIQIHILIKRRPYKTIRRCRLHCVPVCRSLKNCGFVSVFIRATDIGPSKCLRNSQLQLTYSRSAKITYQAFFSLVNSSINPYIAVNIFILLRLLNEHNQDLTIRLELVSRGQPICKLLNQSVSKGCGGQRLACRGWPSIVGQTHFLVLGFHTSCPTDPCVSRATFACRTSPKLPTMPGPQHWLLTSADLFLFCSFPLFCIYVSFARLSLQFFLLCCCFIYFFFCT